jgi:hypothetical protein
MAASAWAVNGMASRRYSPRAGSAKSGAPAVSRVAGPGAYAGEVEVLALVAALEDIQQAVNVGRRGDFLAQLPGQRALQVLAHLDTSAGQDPVAVVPWAYSLDGQQVFVRSDQHGTDAVGHQGLLDR